MRWLLLLRQRRQQVSTWVPGGRWVRRKQTEMVPRGQLCDEVEVPMGYGPIPLCVPCWRLFCPLHSCPGASARLPCSPSSHLSDNRQSPQAPSPSHRPAQPVQTKQQPPTAGARQRVVRPSERRLPFPLPPLLTTASILRSRLASALAQALAAIPSTLYPLPSPVATPDTPHRVSQFPRLP